MEQNVARAVLCAFCKTNGETESQYSSHQLYSKEPNGRRNVECPVLQKHKCEICGATGKNAHTKSYCQYSSGPSVYLSLNKSPRKSNGKRRNV